MSLATLFTPSKEIELSLESKSFELKPSSSITQEWSDCMLEVSINLPVTVLVEQIEMKFNSKKQSLFSKYLKVCGVTNRSILRKEELDDRLTDDIQLTVNELSPE